MSAPTVPSPLPRADRALNAARLLLKEVRNGNPSAPTLQDYNVEGLEAAERMRERPRLR